MSFNKKFMTLLNEIPRNKLDEILFKALQAVYKFQQSKVSIFGLDYEDIYLLQFLRNNSPARMGAIAGEMNIPISTATRVVDRLQKKKFLARKKDDQDKRNILVALEPLGESVVREIEDQTFAQLSDNLVGFTDEDISSFFKTAVHLQKILEPWVVTQSTDGVGSTRPTKKSIGHDS
jgi:DNA-binding MarR family transcriptional regulator